MDDEEIDDYEVDDDKFRDSYYEKYFTFEQTLFMPPWRMDRLIRTHLSHLNPQSPTGDAKC